MRNKPSPVSRPTQPLADHHAVTKPEKGFKRAAALIAKPLKGLGLGGGGRPTLGTSVNHFAKASDSPVGHVAERPVSAEDLASMDRSFARMAASSKVDDIFDESRVRITEIKQEMVRLRELAKDIHISLTKLDKQLESRLPPGTVAEIKADITKHQDLERDTQKTLEKLCGELHEAIDANYAELQETINFYTGRMGNSDELGSQIWRQEILVAKNKQLELRFDKASWQV
jgi:gas vesicle protein